MQGTQNSQNNLEKEHSWRTHTSQFQNLLQSYSDQCGIDISVDIYINGIEFRI